MKTKRISRKIKKIKKKGGSITKKIREYATRIKCWPQNGRIVLDNKCVNLNEKEYLRFLKILK